MVELSIFHRRYKMAKKVCGNCKYIGNPDQATKGNLLIEIILWLFFIIPGVFYSIWRRTNQAEICPKCKQPFMIPIDTPKGKELLPEGFVYDGKETTEISTGWWIIIVIVGSIIGYYFIKSL